MHLAELNLAHLLHDIDDPRVAGFANNLDLVNGIAERSPGFVWRLKDNMEDDVRNEDNVVSVYDNPRIIANLSVWQDIKSFEHFVWNTVHKRFYNNRDKWFRIMKSMNFVMWHVAEGHHPTLAEALERLEYFENHGSSDRAFGWDFVPQATLWRSARCTSEVA